jgi:hypothetical protein
LPSCCLLIPSSLYRHSTRKRLQFYFREFRYHIFIQADLRHQWTLDVDDRSQHINNLFHTDISDSVSVFAIYNQQQHFHSHSHGGLSYLCSLRTDMVANTSTTIMWAILSAPSSPSSFSRKSRVRRFVNDPFVRPVLRNSSAVGQSAFPLRLNVRRFTTRPIRKPCSSLPSPRLRIRHLCVQPP